MKRIFILSFFFIIFSIFLITEELLSSRVRNLTYFQPACSDFSQSSYCEEFFDRGELVDSISNKKNNVISNIDTNKKYNYFRSNYDFSQSYIHNANLLERELKVLSRDLFINENVIKDEDMINLDRVTDYYPSTYKRSTSDIKILAVSDSYGAGAGLYNFDFSWPGTLEHNLFNAGFNVEVDKLVRNGADFLDYLEMLSSKNIELINPDIIVLSVYKNDLLLPIKKSDSLYIKCIKNGYGDNFLENFSKRKFPFIYSSILARKCDLNKLKAKYGDLVGETNYLMLEDAPFADVYKDSMKKILENANGRPVVIQPLFRYEEYETIKNYLQFMKSIGFILPEYDSIEILKFSKKYNREIDALRPVDLHYSRLYNLYLSKISLNAIIKILSDRGYTRSTILFDEVPSIIRFTPERLILYKDNYIEYNRLSNVNLNLNDYKKFIDRYSLVDVTNLDDILCTSVNRQSIRVYLNYYKHKNDKLSFFLHSAESEIAVFGIFFSDSGEELFTKVNIIKPGDSVDFIAENKIIGLVLGNPISGCDKSEVWSMPSFIGQVRYN